MYYRWFLQNALTDLFAVATLYPAWPALSRFRCQSLKTQYAFMYIDVWARPIIKRLHIPASLHVTLNSSCTVYSTCITPLIDGRIFRCQYPCGKSVWRPNGRSTTRGRISMPGRDIVQGFSDWQHSQYCIPQFWWRLCLKASAVVWV